MLNSKNEWLYKEKNNEQANKLAEALQVPYIIGELLLQRGLSSVEQASEFLHNQKGKVHDPFLLDGMAVVKARIQKAIEKQEKILIFGDYDADGVSSTALMVRALKEHGANVSFYIPDRFKEGYGPNIPALKEAIKKGFQLVITVDTGISAVDEAAFAKESGLDYIVTDHHEPPPELPDAFTIINPKKPGCPYPFKSLAGVGVALKVIQALFGEDADDYLALAAIGTIADLVPLEGENRWIASSGLSKMATRTFPGLTALIDVAGLEMESINEEHIGFAMGPRINAAGRMTHASSAAQLFITDDDEEAKQLASDLDRLNKERKSVVEDITAAAMIQAETQRKNKQDVLVISGENWHEGVVGIVASRVVEKFYRPAIILSIDSETGKAKGSARSVEGFDVFQALSSCRALLPHFGGHPMAAGMSLSVEDIPLLETRLNEWAAANAAAHVFIPKVSVDSVCRIEDVSLELIETLQMMAPFGVGNPKPVFAIKDAKLSQLRQIGKNKDHLKLVFSEGEQMLDAIAFQKGHLSQEIAKEVSVSVLGELSINEWNGYRKPQMLVKDLAVEEWQLFDWRSERDLPRLAALLPVNKVKIIAFHEETVLSATGAFGDMIVEMAMNLSAPELQGHYVLFLDIPDDLEDLSRLLDTENFPERIYAAFKTESSQYFSGVPSREQFKKVYAFLNKYQPVNQSAIDRRLSSLTGISVPNIKFIIQVFFDLNFVKIDNGLLSVADHAEKKDLTASESYKMRVKQIETEETLCYSSYSSLKQWMKETSKERTEAKEATSK